MGCCAWKCGFATTAQAERSAKVRSAFQKLQWNNSFIHSKIPGFHSLWYQEQLPDLITQNLTDSEATTSVTSTEQMRLYRHRAAELGLKCLMPLENFGFAGPTCQGGQDLRKRGQGGLRDLYRLRFGSLQ